MLVERRKAVNQLNGSWLCQTTGRQMSSYFDRC